MHRVVVAVVLACLAPAPAFAGQRCKERPEPVFMDADLDIHGNGNWHDDDGPAGRLSPAAKKRFDAFRASGASDAKVRKCLDALIAKEKGKAAKRACKVKKKKR